MLQIFFASAIMQTPTKLLGPGSPVPKMAVKAWIKGTPVISFEKSKTYVIEFWATWCGPCIEGIPHITSLSKKFPSVKFIGVSTFEENEKKQVQEFVAKMGDKMDYTVAYSGNKDGMAASWLAPSKQSGIPVSFVIKDNVIQWIGYLGNLEGTLNRLQKNEFDIDAARKKFEAQISGQEAALKLGREIELCDNLYDSGKTTEAKSKLDKLEETAAGKLAARDIRFKWESIERPETWRTKALEMMNAGEENKNKLCFFMNN
ncbi:MAG: redoxin family protein, partial [Armatimonadota bacterium]